MSQRQKYSDNEILDMLRECKEEQGKCTPELFRQQEGTCSVSLVSKRFGSWKDGKKEAGIYEDLSSETGRHKQYEDEQILSQLHELYRREGRCTTELLQEQDDMIVPSVAIERFGSWIEAKKKAGIPVTDDRSDNKRPTAYSDEELLQCLRDCAEKHGKCTQRKFDEDSDFPSSGVVRKRFETWSNAKDKAGLKTVGTGNQKYSADELLEMIRICDERHGGCTASQFAADDEFCSPETVQRRFGSWSDAKEKALGDS